MKARYRIQALRIVAVGSALLFLSACGGSAEPEAPVAPSDAGQQSDQPDAATEPADGADGAMQISQEAGDALCTDIGAATEVYGDLTARIVDKNIYFSLEGGSVDYQQVECMMTLVGEAAGIEYVAVTVHAMPGRYDGFAEEYFSLLGETDAGEAFEGTDLPARKYMSGGFGAPEAYAETADGFGIRVLLTAQDGNTALTTEQANAVLNAAAEATQHL